MRKTFLSEISKLKDKIYVDKKIIKQFLEKLKSGLLTKKQNPSDHFCAFFLPIDLTSKSIYLGHHIKADDWIPPGGHIDKNELPIQTVHREFYEELNFNLNKEKVELFDLTIKDVSGNPIHRCKTHFDFWYLVYINKRKFRFDKKEFYQAEWLTISQGIKRMKLSQYSQVIKNISRFIF